MQPKRQHTVCGVLQLKPGENQKKGLEAAKFRRLHFCKLDSRDDIDEARKKTYKLRNN